MPQPYINPGYAATQAIESFLQQQEQLRRQREQDALARQREERLARGDELDIQIRREQLEAQKEARAAALKQKSDELIEKHQEQEHKNAVARIGALKEGDYATPQDEADSQKYGIPLRLGVAGIAPIPSGQQTVSLPGASPITPPEGIQGPTVPAPTTETLASAEPMRGLRLAPKVLPSPEVEAQRRIRTSLAEGLRGGLPPQEVIARYLEQGGDPKEAEGIVSALKPKMAAVPELGTFGDYLNRISGGKPETLTPQQIEIARKKWGEEGRREPAPASDKLVKVEHRDPATGRTVIEYLPQSDLRGQKFEKGLGSVVENRRESAQTVTDVGTSLIQKLQQPQYRDTLGPILGRYSSLQDFIGNPPPEFSELAGEIDSFALANMGVHGMRSAQGAEMIKKLLTGKHTPESLSKGIEGLLVFSKKYVENTNPIGAGAPSGAPKVGDTLNGKKVIKVEPYTGR